MDERLYVYREKRNAPICKVQRGKTLELRHALADE